MQCAVPTVDASKLLYLLVCNFHKTDKEQTQQSQKKDNTMKFQEPTTLQSSTTSKAARKPSYVWDGDTLILNPAAFEDSYNVTPKKRPAQIAFSSFFDDDSDDSDDRSVFTLESALSHAVSDDDEENGEPFNVPIITKKRRRTSRTKRVGGGSFLSMFSNFIPVEEVDCTSLDTCPFEQEMPLLPTSELLRLVECTNKINRGDYISLHGNGEGDIAIDYEVLDMFANVPDDAIQSTIDSISIDEYSTSSTLESDSATSEPAQNNSGFDPTNEGSLLKSSENSSIHKNQGDLIHQESSHGGNVLSTSITPIVLTDIDVLLGRGNRSNGHAGNERFRKLVDKMKPIYRKQGNSKKGKNSVSIAVMEAVHDYGGRFLEVISKPGLPLAYKVADRKKARKKCSQRLREGEQKE